MTVYFGAARVTIDLGDNGTRNFNSRLGTKSIPLAEPVTDRSGKVIREQEDSDPRGRELWRAMQGSLKLLKNALDPLPEDALELRIARTPHPEHLDDPEYDTVSIQYRPNGQFTAGNLAYHGITENGLGRHQTMGLFGLLLTRLEAVSKK